MTLKYHKNLTLEKWGNFPFHKQILMVANELNRAKNWIEKKDAGELALCYERAFELLYLTIEMLKEKNKRKELLRFKEMLGGLYLKKPPMIEENTQLLKALLSLDRNAFLCGEHL